MSRTVTLRVMLPPAGGRYSALELTKKSVNAAQRRPRRCACAGRMDGSAAHRRAGLKQTTTPAVSGVPVWSLIEVGRSEVKCRSQLPATPGSLARHKVGDGASRATTFADGYRGLNGHEG